jgi:hypothetical protein
MAEKKHRLGLRLINIALLACLACTNDRPFQEERTPPALPQDAQATIDDGGHWQMDAGIIPRPDRLSLTDIGQVSTQDSGLRLDASIQDAQTFLSDQDRDGLPDNEDPDPQRYNAMIFSDEFTQIGSDWSFTSVSMKIDTSAQQLRVIQVEPYVREGWIGPRPGWGDVFIKTKLRLRRTGNSPLAGAGQAGLIGRVNQLSPDRYVVCGVNLRNSTVFISEHNGGAAVGQVLAERVISTQANQWFDLTFDIDGNSMRCIADKVEVSAASNLYFSGAIGFRSFDATFDAENIFVYAR